MKYAFHVDELAGQLDVNENYQQNAEQNITDHGSRHSQISFMSRLDSKNSCGSSR